jgi:hypothetical protein
MVVETSEEAGCWQDWRPGGRSSRIRNIIGGRGAELGPFYGKSLAVLLFTRTRRRRSVLRTGLR